MKTARLSRITIFPIKSLPGIDVDRIEVLANGALENDRRFAMVDATGKFINGKRTPAVHQIGANYDLAKMNVCLTDRAHNRSADFSLTEEGAAVADWLSDALGVTCDFVENSAGGFPDDTDAPGPTLLGTETLREVAGWFPDLALEETRRRFRANLEVEGVPPFWEDQAVGAAAESESPIISVGDVRWLGTKICQRCVVPSRAAATGKATPSFQKTFAVRRGESLPSWSPRGRFDHFYRLAVNMSLVAGCEPGQIKVGDQVKLTL